MSGVVIVQSKTEVQHQGIILTVDGAVNLQLSPKSVGLFEAFYNSVKVSKHSGWFWFQFLCLMGYQPLWVI